ncbi:MAG: hypothetical protein PHC51_06685 [bacterium]|nr:hypothetical protein [bacterium]
MTDNHHPDQSGYQTDERGRDDISLHSHHFSGVLSRSGLSLDRESLCRVFTWALNNGGWLEHDFSRPAGQTFNPRPARVGIILINDLGADSQELLEAGLASSVALPGDRALPGCELLLPQAAELVDDYQRFSIDDVSRLLATERGLGVAKVILANYLDRTRQIHRRQDEDRADYWRKVYQEREPYFRLAEHLGGVVENYLKQWLWRFELRIRREEAGSVK